MNNLTTTNKNSKLVLSKAKNMMNIVNEILINKNNKSPENFDNFRFSLSLSEGVEAISISADGKYIVSASLDKTIKLWDINRGKVIRTFKGHEHEVDSVVITHDGKYIFSGSKDYVLKQWEVATGKEIRTFDNHDTDYYYIKTLLTITQNGKYVLFVITKRSMDNKKDGISIFKLLDINSGKEVLYFEYQNSMVDSVSITPDSKYIVSGSEWTENIKLWDINTGEEVQTFEGKVPTEVTPDGKHILFQSKSEKGYFKLLDISSGKEIKKFCPNYKGSFSKVVITPDSKFCIFIRWSVIKESIVIYNLENDTKEDWYDRLHNNNINSLAVTPDGKHLVTASSNKDYDEEHKNIDSLKLWDINTGDTIRTFGGINYITYKGIKTFPITIEEIEKWDLDKKTPLEIFNIKFEDNEWLIWTKNGEYNCSDGAYKYFSFIDDNNETPEVLDIKHPIYIAKKKDKLL